MAASRPTYETEIQFLVDLKDDPSDSVAVKRKKLVAQEALREWKESVEVLEGKLSRRTKRVDCLTNEIYQLVGLYGVFVGVVFTAVQPDRVQCQHVWSPIVLCVLPCFVIVHIIDKKLSDIRRFRDEIAVDESSRKVHLKNLGILKRKGYSEFDIRTDPVEGKAPLNDHTGITRPGVIRILLLSSAVIVGSFVHILCFTEGHSGEGSGNWNDYTPGCFLPS